MTWVTNYPGHERMVDVLREGLRQATRVDIAVSYVRATGVALLLEQLRGFSARGGTARILATTSMHITQPEALRTLAGLPGIACRVHASNLIDGAVSEGFHAKLYLFELSSEQAMCVVGSSNLSSGGLISNIESNVLHDAPAHITQGRAFFEALWTHPDVLTLDDVYTPYAQAYLEALALQRPPPSSPLLTPRHALLPESTPSPNPAQSEALARLASLREAGEQRAAVIAATGVGKTFLAAFDAQQSKARRVLFVSHRLEHLTQARDTFARVFGRSATQGLLAGGEKQSGRDHVFATVQSATSARWGVLDEPFDYVVIDEFHHADAPSYRELIRRVQTSFLLGLTATPERADGQDVLELCDYNVAYEVRLVEAIERGWLIPFYYFGLCDETVDYEAIPWRNRRFDPGKLEHALMLEARADHILEHALAHGYDGESRVTVGFCAGVRHAEFMADAFNARLASVGEHVAIALTGSASLAHRQDVYARLQRSDDPLEWLFVADLLNEGVDLPALNSLLFLRPTQSATIFLQQLGRGLRTHSSCEVLTVLDFVGHHKRAWSVLEALHDSGSVRGPSTLDVLGITPPKHCEIVLDDRTLEIITKVKQSTQKGMARCDEAYMMLRDELGRAPMPVDLFERVDVPEYPKRWRSTARPDWIAHRAHHGDLMDWEQALDAQSPTRSFLAALERDWQEQRIYTWALLWGMLQDDMTSEQGYEAFFERYPRWRVEHKPLEQTSALKTLGKRLGEQHVSLKGGLSVELLQGFPDAVTRHMQIMCRLTPWMQRDYMMRHGGTLSSPDALVRHRRYTRPEIMHHFGVQYDPTRHNKGVIEFGSPRVAHIVIITKIDTTGAAASHQYNNAFVDASTMTWQSQNKQSRDRSSGQRLVEHVERGITLHMFVQRDKHDTPIYCGPVLVKLAAHDKPIDVTFRLVHPLPPMVLAQMMSVEA